MRLITATVGPDLAILSSPSGPLAREQLELALVRESLVERAQLLNTAPHLVEPLRFLVPI